MLYKVWCDKDGWSEQKFVVWPATSALQAQAQVARDIRCLDPTDDWHGAKVVRAEEAPDWP